MLGHKQTGMHCYNKSVSENAGSEPDLFTDGVLLSQVTSINHGKCQVEVDTLSQWGLSYKNIKYLINFMKCVLIRFKKQMLCLGDNFAGKALATQT